MISGPQRDASEQACARRRCRSRAARLAIAIPSSYARAALPRAAAEARRSRVPVLVVDPSSASCRAPALLASVPEDVMARVRRPHIGTARREIFSRARLRARVGIRGRPALGSRRKTEDRRRWSEYLTGPALVRRRATSIPRGRRGAPPTVSASSPARRLRLALSASAGGGTADPGHCGGSLFKLPPGNAVPDIAFRCEAAAARSRPERLERARRGPLPAAPPLSPGPGAGAVEPLPHQAVKELCRAVVSARGCDDGSSRLEMPDRKFGSA